MALKRKRPQCSISCLDLEHHLAEIAQAGFADYVGTLSDSILRLKDSDIVILASPVETIIEHLNAIAPHLLENTVVTDVGSTKKEIMKHARSVLPSGVFFIGGHPVAGSEKSGVRAADSMLFKDRAWVLCPFSDTPPGALLTVMDLVGDLMAVPLTIEPDEHDRVFAMISHVPQILAIALVHAALQEDVEHSLLNVAVGRGFLDLTRIAASEFDIWKGVLDTNRGPIMAMLDKFESSLNVVKQKLHSGDLSELWAKVSARRRSMG
jgi:prephenate dehydrogenase